MVLSTPCRDFLFGNAAPCVVQCHPALDFLADRLSNCVLNDPTSAAGPSSPLPMAHSLARPLPAAPAPAAPLCRRQQTAAAQQQQQQARLPRLAATPAAAAAAAEKAAVPVTFAIGGSEVTVEAQPGQNIWEVRAAGSAAAVGAWCLCSHAVPLARCGCPPPTLTPGPLASVSCSIFLLLIAGCKGCGSGHHTRLQPGVVRRVRGEPEHAEAVAHCAVAARPPTAT